MTISKQVSLTHAIFSPEIRAYRPRNPHLQSPPGLLLTPPQPGFSSSPQKRHRQPSDNPDPDSDHDPENQPYKRTGAEPLRGTKERLSLTARRVRDSGLTMSRLAAQIKTNELMAARMREGLTDGVWGRVAAGREVRGDGRLVMV